MGIALALLLLSQADDTEKGVVGLAAVPLGIVSGDPLGLAGLDVDMAPVGQGGDGQVSVLVVQGELTGGGDSTHLPAPGLHPDPLFVAGALVDLHMVGREKPPGGGGPQAVAHGGAVEGGGVLEIF